MTEATTVPDYPRGITFEQVWAALMEDRERIMESRKESREQIMESRNESRKEIMESRERIKEIEQLQKETAEQMKETDRRQKETDRIVKETAEQMKENGRQMGYLSNRFGEVAEHLVKPGIYKRFNEMGYHFDAMAKGGFEIQGQDGKTKAEIDLLLENDDTVMAVEVKATPKVKHVAEHVKRLEILRDYRRKKNDLRQVEGAVAGAVFGVEEKKAAIEAGLYVIVQSGDTMKIEVPDGFVPKRW